MTYTWRTSATERREALQPPQAWRMVRDPHQVMGAASDASPIPLPPPLPLVFFIFPVAPPVRREVPPPLPPAVPRPLPFVLTQVANVPWNVGYSATRTKSITGVAVMPFNVFNIVVVVQVQQCNQTPSSSEELISRTGGALSSSCQRKPHKAHNHTHRPD